MEPDLEPLDHEATRPDAGPRRSGRKRPRRLPDLLQLRRGMNLVTTELTKVVNYPAVDVQMTLRRMEKQMTLRRMEKQLDRMEVMARNQTARMEELHAISTTRDRNRTARFYNQMVAKRFDAISVMYSLVTDQENNLEVNMMIPDFPRTLNDLSQIDARTSRNILQALEFPNHALDDVGLKLAVRKAIGVGFVVEVF